VALEVHGDEADVDAFIAAVAARDRVAAVLTRPASRNRYNIARA
jgi:hypothetical protein